MVGFRFCARLPVRFQPPTVSSPMSIASDKLEVIRQQVQYHLDHEERKRLSPEREEELRGRV